jgi:hypothetical protein
MRILETTSLFNVAINAARSIKAPTRSGGQQPALVSIVFSVTTMESFFNEITELALSHTKLLPEYEAPQVSVFADFMVQAEESRASLESKFLVGSWILSGKRLDKGARIYQDFARLLQLRNNLLHYKAKPNFYADWKTPPEELHKEFISKFRDKKILADDASGKLVSWTYFIETKAVAEWSCQTAAQMIVNFCSAIPRGVLKSSLRLPFEQGFALENLSSFFRSSDTANSVTDSRKVSRDRKPKNTPKKARK